MHAATMKRRILKILKNSGRIVSGQELSAQLGISRVSVWKHIQRLQALGYVIASSAKGYRLENAPDVPYPWEFPGRESTIVYHEELTSTMETAKELARKGCPDYTIVIAGRQSGGRGRLKRKWFSDTGGLYFTMVLRPDLPPVSSFRVSFAVSLTLAGLLNEMFGVDVRLKWPNDLLVDERKLCGILSELEGEADRVAFVNVGVGINVNNDPSDIEPAATSLKAILGREVSRKDIMARFLDAFEERMKTAAFDRVIEEWKAHTVTLNREVRVVTIRETFTGKAVDIDESGALVLQCADGSLQKVLYGDCFHQSY